MWFTGDTALLDGQKQISPTTPFVILSSGNPLPYLGMWTRDIGGQSYGPNDPGVSNGRGALNVGLLAKVCGIVTYRDTSATPAFFYVWDGANKMRSALNDGSGNYGVRILHSGLVDPDGTGPLPVREVVPGQDRVEVAGVVSVNQTAVPGKTIPEILPASAPVILSDADFTTISEPTGSEITQGRNLGSLPAVPKDPNPAVVFAPVSSEILDYCLFRWEAAGQGLLAYDMFDPEGFGGMLLGDGWWLMALSNYTVSYQGRVQTDAQWYTLPCAGWAIMGQPFGHSTYWSDVKVHNGGEAISLETAARTRNWLDSVIIGWNSMTGSSFDVGLPDDYCSSDRLVPWHGYWVHPHQAGLSLIIPESPVAP